MIRSTWLVGAAAALALGLMVVSAEAAPAIGAATGYKAAVGESSVVQDAYWGRRHHRHAYYGYYSSPYPYWRYYAAPRYYYGYAPSLRYYGAPRHRHVVEQVIRRHAEQTG